MHNNSHSLTLGYLHNYPKELVNAWSSGTGMAGVLGAVLYIGLCKNQMISCD